MNQAIAERMNRAASVLGFDPSSVEQGSYEWHKMRLGVITASKAHILTMKPSSETYRKYMAELCAEIATGAPMEEISSKAIAWGREHESSAIATWEMINGQPLSRVPLIYGETMREACSPDAVNGSLGWETKCPLITTHHVMTLVDGTIKKEYRWQCQYSIRVSGFEGWVFNSFDPRMKKNQLASILVEPVEADQKTLADAVPQFVHEMDKMLKSIGHEFGDQWSSKYE